MGCNCGKATITVPQVSEDGAVTMVTALRRRTTYKWQLDYEGKTQQFHSEQAAREFMEFGTDTEPGAHEGSLMVVPV